MYKRDMSNSGPNDMSHDSDRPKTHQSYNLLVFFLVFILYYINTKYILDTSWLPINQKVNPKDVTYRFGSGMLFFYVI